MNIYSYLKKDHEKVAALLEKIIKTTSESKRTQLFETLEQELLLHADAEHATFYKALKIYPETKELIKHADKEHEEVKEYLHHMKSGATHNTEWMILLGELKYAVEHHVEEEEGEIFKKARQLLDKETEKNLVHDMEEFKEKALQN